MPPFSRKARTGLRSDARLSVFGATLPTWIDRLFRRSPVRASYARGLDWSTMFRGDGEQLTPDAAMRCATVYACVRVIANSFAAAPFHLYQKTSIGRQRLDDHPVSYILNKQPNDWQSAFEFKRMASTSINLRGNFYAQIARNKGSIKALHAINPDTVTVIPPSGNEGIKYRTQDNDGMRVHEAQDILHVRALGSHGYVGLSPIEQGRRAIQFSLQGEKHGYNMLQNGAKAGAVMEHPGTLSDEASARLRASILDQTTGDNSFGLLISEEGMKYQQMGMSSTDAQYLENRKYQRVEICAMFGVPPHMAGDLERATFSNIEQQGLEFYTQTLFPNAVLWEQRLGLSLLTRLERDSGIYIESSFDAMLRADINTRYNSYRTGLQEGFLSANEVRAKENMDPRPGGDDYRVPANSLPSGVTVL